MAKVEKGMAEEQARQAERQAQDLMEERAKIKAEKEELKRNNNEMAARLQFLEGIISESEALGESADDDELSFAADELEACSPTEIKQASPSK